VSAGTAARGWGCGTAARTSGRRWAAVLDGSHRIWLIYWRRTAAPDCGLRWAADRPTPVRRPIEGRRSAGGGAEGCGPRGGYPAPLVAGHPRQEPVLASESGEDSSSLPLCHPGTELPAGWRRVADPHSPGSGLGAPPPRRGCAGSIPSGVGRAAGRCLRAALSLAGLREGDSVLPTASRSPAVPSNKRIAAPRPRNHLHLTSGGSQIEVSFVARLILILSILTARRPTP